jgi:hypothetical protein
MYARMHIWMYGCVRVYGWIYAWLCACASKYVCMGGWMCRVCMERTFICVCIWMYVCICGCMYVMHLYMYGRVCVCVCLYACMHGCVCICGCMHLSIYVWVDGCVSVCMYGAMYVRTYVCMHVYMDVYTDVCIDVCMYAYMDVCICWVSMYVMHACMCLCVLCMVCACGQRHWCHDHLELLATVSGMMKHGEDLQHAPPFTRTRGLWHLHRAEQNLTLLPTIDRIDRWLPLCHEGNTESESEQAYMSLFKKKETVIDGVLRLFLSQSKSLHETCVVSCCCRASRQAKNRDRDCRKLEQSVWVSGSSHGGFVFFFFGFFFFWGISRTKFRSVRELGLLQKDAETRERDLTSGAVFLLTKPLDASCGVCLSGKEA